MKPIMVALTSLLFLANPGQAANRGNHSLLRIPGPDGSVTYEVVPTQEAPGRVNTSRAIQEAMDQAYKEIRAEWIEENHKAAQKAIDQNRRNSNRRRKSGKNRSIVTTKTFPLSKAPEGKPIQYVGSFATEKDARRRMEQLVKREKAGEGSRGRNATLDKMRAKNSLASPARSSARAAAAAEMREKIEERALELAEASMAQSKSGKRGLKPSGLSRPASGKNDMPRVGDGLKTFN